MHKLTSTDINSEIITKAINMAQNGIVITDIDGKIVWVNDYICQLTGYTHAEMIGENPRLLKSEKEPVETYKVMWKKISSGQKWQGRIVNKKKDDSFYIERLSITPIFDKENIIGYIGIQQDITIEEGLRDQLTEFLEKTREELKLRKEKII